MVPVAAAFVGITASDNLHRPVQLAAVQGMLGRPTDIRWKAHIPRATASGLSYQRQWLSASSCCATLAVVVAARSRRRYQRRSEGCPHTVVRAYATASQPQSETLLSGGQVDERKLSLLMARDGVDKLLLDKSFGPIFVRFAWHDSGTFDKALENRAWPAAGGAIGSIIYDKELTAGPNAGLKLAYKVLSAIQKETGCGWADLIQLASARAVELYGGPKIAMQYGRVDALKSPDESVAPFGLPDALPPFGGPPQAREDPAAHLIYVFRKYGMDDRDIVALSGAHTLGRAFEQRSGTVEYGYNRATEYTLRGCPLAKGSITNGGQSWTKEWLEFDNSYFIEVDKHVNAPGLVDKELVAFPTDIVLATDPRFKPHFDLFKTDQAAFFDAYAVSHKKLSELGSKFDRPFSL